MSKHYTQSESMKALEQSLNDHMEICSLRGKVKRLKAKNARLKAEVARLRASSFVTAVPVEHYERVVKAGDAVVADLEYLTKSGWFNKCKSVKLWNAAKEGKPSV